MSAADTTAGSRFPYEDPVLPVDQRVADLLGRMTVEDKAGLMFQSMTAYSDPDQRVDAFGLPSLNSMIERRRMTHFNLTGSPETARDMVQWHNRAQDIAFSMPLRIPLTLSTDPRHSFTDNPGAAMLSGAFSQWPEPLGLAAIGSEQLVEEFADIARQEYLAVGLRTALHPQVDVATEPRWARINGTFGEDADLVARLGAAYVRGFQTAAFGECSVSTMVKHFPGGGPQKDGEDPHFDYGKDQVYPGGNLEEHLTPFRAAFAAGARQVMPYYGRPVGTEYEEVGFGFNKGVITDLLRDRMGFDGIVCTDWGLLTDVEVLGQPMPARAWGMEDATREERLLKALDAGVDQFGGELCPEVLVGLVRAGKVSEERLDRSAARLLREKFLLGLFDHRHLDPHAAQEVVGCAPFAEAGRRAQSASVTVLVNGPEPEEAALPLPRGRRLYVEGVGHDAAAAYGRVVDAPEDADVAILRIKAPFERRGGGFEAFFHAGSLDFPAETLHHIAEVSAQVPTILDVYLDRPAILTPIVEAAEAPRALVVDYGASDPALLDVLFGQAEPRGFLPFDLPRSMDAVRASREDVPFDTAAPLFRHGFGLRIPSVPGAAAAG